MVPRWSRLALAAILAFGASPGVAAASENAADLAASCCGERDGAPGASLVVAVTGEDVDRHGACHAQPLCAAAAAPLAAPMVALVQVDDLRVAAAEAGPRIPAWRQAPKTSPPRR